MNGHHSKTVLINKFKVLKEKVLNSPAPVIMINSLGILLSPRCHNTTWTQYFTTSMFNFNCYKNQSF